jgi:membrane protein
VTKQHKLSEPNSSFFGNAFGLLKQTGQEFLEDKAPQLGAALAYYTVFSLAPLILVLLALVGIMLWLLGFIGHVVGSLIHISYS